MFERLDDRTRVLLAQRSSERRYKKGQFIVHQGDPGDSLFVVAEGLVKILVTSEDGNEMVLATLGPSQTFGELSLIDGEARSASAETVEQTSVLVLTRRSFLELLHTDPSLIASLLESLGGVVRRLTEQASDFVFLDLYGRVAKLLLALAPDRADGMERALAVKLTQSDLAGMVGGSRQSVNQILQSFERRGYIRFEGRRIVVLLPEKLEQRAGI